ncbi:MAG: histidine phosphatase family protein [Myxococcota bacterium]
MKKLTLVAAGLLVAAGCDFSDPAPLPTTAVGGGGGGGGDAAGGSPANGGGGTGGTSLLQAGIVDGDVSLSWSLPGASFRVLRRLNTPPDGADDGAAETVYEGDATTARDDLEGLLPDTAETRRTYHYAVFACDGGDTCGGDGATATVTPTVGEALRGGGYVIAWRHSPASVCSDDLSLGEAATTTQPDWWRSCNADCATATTRQLNAQGLMEAPIMGDALKARGIPFSAVLSSEFCRCFTTAELMDLGPPVEQLPDLTYFVYGDALRCERVYDLIETVPADDTNVALIGHAGFVCPVLDALQQGDAAIFKPDGEGDAILIQVVKWNQWSSLP